MCRLIWLWFRGIYDKDPLNLFSNIMYELSSTFNSWLKYSLVFTGGQRREQMSWSHKYVPKLSLFFLYCHFLCYLSAINTQWYTYTIWNKLISADISAQLVCNLLYYYVGDGWQKDLWGITNSCVHFWLVQKKKLHWNSKCKITLGPLH